MFKNLTIGQFIPGDSVIHRLDPRTKIIATLIYIILLFLIKDFYGYLLLSPFILLPIFLSGISVKYIFKGLRPLIVLIIITMTFNILFTTGEILYKLGPFKITKEGLEMSFFIALRLIFLVTGTSYITLTTSPIALTDGIEYILNPFKKIGLPAHELAMMMTIALRFIPTLLEETEKIIKAQTARGADFQSRNILNKAKNLVPLLVPLFISAFRRADELAMAMEARCYRGGENRTRMNQLKISSLDYITFAFTAIISCVVIITRFNFGVI
ncbi:MAG TPA: energy-coupling factor transporter transmembrane protein EcfT [Thermoanaerobacterales bacterium]|nr:energy-coupling factor transporter transmembrane protein EcfT [Thermoanaerobacterales bacterium]